jgi:hypothetical protein
VPNVAFRRSRLFLHETYLIAVVPAFDHDRCDPVKAKLVCVGAPWQFVHRFQNPLCIVRLFVVADFGRGLCQVHFVRVRADEVVCEVDEDESGGDGEARIPMNDLMARVQFIKQAGARFDMRRHRSLGLERDQHVPNGNFIKSRQRGELAPIVTRKGKLVSIGQAGERFPRFFWREYI